MKQPLENIQSQKVKVSVNFVHKRQFFLIKVVIGSESFVWTHGKIRFLFKPQAKNLKTSAKNLVNMVCYLFSKKPDSNLGQTVIKRS